MVEKKYADYVESDAVKQARAALEAQSAKNPGTYTSQWQTSINDTLNKILNRDKFSYDVNGDALYQQYKDKYIQQGKLAMADTIGQASAMTGGYGNSYATTAGYQAYQQNLQQLNDVVPELYSLAYDRYKQEGTDLQNQYALLSDRENADYSRYRDSVNDYNTEREYLTGRYDSERNYDYNQYTDNRDFTYQQDRDAVSDAQWQKNFDKALRQYNEQLAYQKQRDAVSDSQWQQEYNLSNQKAAASSTTTTKTTKTGLTNSQENRFYTLMEEDPAQAHAYLNSMLASGVDSDIVLSYFNQLPASYRKKYELGSNPGVVNTSVASTNKLAANNMIYNTSPITQKYLKQMESDLSSASKKVKK